jgi:hypothetical protein
MKAPTLDDVVAAWTAIPPAERAARLAALKVGTPAQDDGALVERWTPAARKIGVTVRALRNAVKAAGIKPVALPGRTRAIGIRTRDLLALVDCRAGFTVFEVLLVIAAAATVLLIVCGAGR